MRVSRLNAQRRWSSTSGKYLEHRNPATKLRYKEGSESRPLVGITRRYLYSSAHEGPSCSATSRRCEDAHNNTQEV
eukprot:14744-Eustigmatos_ZCMA.PRE.1